MHLWSWDEQTPAQILARPYSSPPSWPAKYPLLHRDLLKAEFALASPLARLAGVEEGTPLEHALFLAGRVLSLVLALLTVRLIFVTARDLASRRAGWIAAFSWLAVLPQVYYAKTMNLDAPYVFWLALAVWAFVHFRAAPTLPLALAFGIGAAAAILTKDQSLGLFILPGLLLIYECSRRGRSADRRRVPLLLASAAIALLCAFLSYRLFAGSDLLRTHLVELVGVPERYATKVPGEDSALALLALAFRHVRWSFGTPLMVLVAGATVLALLRGARRRPEVARGSAVLLLFPLSYYLFSIIPLGYHYDRFFLPVCWTLALVAACELDPLFERLPAGLARGGGAALLVAVLGWGIARTVAIDRAMVQDRRFALERLTDGSTRATFFRFEIRPPRGFERHRIGHLEEVPLQELSPYEWIAIPMKDLGEPGLSRLAARLRTGICGFRPVEPQFAEPSDIDRFPGFRGVLSNLEEIDPPFLVFHRALPPTPCS